MIRFIDTFDVLKLQEVLSNVSSVLSSPVGEMCLSVGCNKTFWMVALTGYMKSLN